MPTSLCEMIHQRDPPPEGMALHIDAIREFAAREMVKALSLELNYPVSEYNPSNDFLRQ